MATEVDRAVRWAIVPVAGRGERLEPATAVVPKALLPIGLRPMLHWTLAEAIAAGFRSIVLVVGPEQRAVRRYVEEAVARDAAGRTGALARLGGHLRTIGLHWVVQPRPRGLGDALIRCESFTGSHAFAVLLPDNWFVCDEPAIGQVVAGFRETGCPSLGLTLVRAEEAGLYGPVGGVELEQLGPDTHRILALQDKGDGAFRASGRDRELRGCGRYVLTAEFYDALRATAPADRDPDSAQEWDDVPAFQRLIGARRLVGRRIHGRHFDAGQPPGFGAANRFAHAAPGAE